MTQITDAVTGATLFYSTVELNTFNAGSKNFDNIKQIRPVQRRIQ